MKIFGIILTLFVANCTALVCDSGWQLYDSEASSQECEQSDPPKGYRKCLKMFAEEKSWNDAKASCEDNEARLVKIESHNENTFLLDTFLQIPSGEEQIESWIGLTDQEEENEYVWTDGTPVNPNCTNWADEQPNDEDGEQDCAEIANGVFWPGGPPQIGVWNDFQCNSVLMYICEKGREEYNLGSESR